VESRISSASKFTRMFARSPSSVISSPPPLVA
jgi:hypothetical protein